MATTYWNATGANQTWTTDGNWSGSHPGTDDIAVLDGRSQNAVDGIDDSATDYQAVRVTPNYGGTIGSSGTSLTLAVSNTSTSSDPRFTFAGSGAAYIAAGGNGIDYLDVQRAPGGFFLTGGTTAAMYITSGRVNIGASATVTTLYVLGGEVSIAQGATITTMNHYAGTVIAEAGATTLNTSGGRFVAREAAAFTTINNYGSTLNLQSTGTAGTVNLFRGTLTPAGAKDNVTITTLNQYAPARFIRNASGVTVTVTTENEIGDLSRYSTDPGL